jgi:ribosome assembly protein YihI (activator of Der GTPase)
MPDEYAIRRQVETKHSEQEKAEETPAQRRKAKRRAAEEANAKERAAAEQQKAQERAAAEQERAKERAKERAAAEQEKARVAVETNAPEVVGVVERELQSALQVGSLYWRTASNQLVYIGDILNNYRKLRRLLDTLAADELWPCILTHSMDARPFSAPLEVPPTLAAMLVAQLRTASTDELPFPSAPADAVQHAVAVAAEEKSLELLRFHPFFFWSRGKLVALPAENAEAGFVRGAKLDTDIRAPFSSHEPLDLNEEPPRARVAVETSPNLTVIYSHGYFASTTKQLGISTPACGTLAYGLYRFGLEIKGYHLFQESLVCVPEQLRVLLDPARVLED